MFWLRLMNQPGRCACPARVPPEEREFTRRPRLAPADVCLAAFSVTLLFPGGRGPRCAAPPARAASRPPYCGGSELARAAERDGWVHRRAGPESRHRGGRSAPDCVVQVQHAVAPDHLVGIVKEDGAGVAAEEAH